MPPMLLPFFVILLTIFSILRNRSKQSMENQKDSFLEKERRANHTRRKDISGLAYIKVPLSDFPIGRFPDEKLASCEEALLNISSRQILNLSGISNTDLKLQYGAANLPALSDYDANFTTFARTLVSYAERLAELGHWQEAVTVLEFGVSCRTDISTNYTLLGSLYREHGEEAKLKELIQTVRQTDLLLKASILEKLGG